MDQKASFERQSMMMRRATRLMRVVGEWKAVVTSLSSVERRPSSTQHKRTGTIRKSTHHKRTIRKGTHRTQAPITLKTILFQSKEKEDGLCFR